MKRNIYKRSNTLMKRITCALMKEGKMKQALRIFPLSIAALCLLTANAANASATLNNVHVTNAGSYGDGHVFVYVDQNIPESGCTTNRFDVLASVPAAKQILGMALTALATGKTVIVSTDGCMASYASQITSPGSGYIIIVQ